MDKIDNFITGEVCSGANGSIRVNIHEAVRPNFFPVLRRVTYKGEVYRVVGRSVGMILTDPGIPFDMLELDPEGPRVCDVWEYSPAGESADSYTFVGEGIGWRDNSYYVWNRLCDGCIFVIPKQSFQNNLHIWKRVDNG